MINLVSGQSGAGMTLALCGPSDVNGTALRSGSVVPGPGVRIPAQRSALMSGNGDGLVDSTCDTVLAHDDTSPDSLIPSRMAALRTLYASQHVPNRDIKPSAADNKNARPTASLNATSMFSPVVERSIINVRKSNLDLNGRLVKKGALVSWHGYRFHVSKVRMGVCYPVFSPNRLRFFDCNSVQVVA